MTRLSVILLTGWELLFISSWFIISVNVDALEARLACRRDQVKLSGFPFGRQGDDPTFSHSSDRLGTSVHLFLVHNICQCRCTWSTSGLQERSGKTIREISKHCCRLSLGFRVVKQTIPPSFFPVPLSNFWLWVYSVEFLLRTFYHESFHLNCSF